MSNPLGAGGPELRVFIKRKKFVDILKHFWNILIDDPFSCIFSGPINSGTQALLVSPGVSVPGTLSITASEVYFEVDEESEEYKNIDPKVGTNFIHISMIILLCLSTWVIFSL